MCGLRVIVSVVIAAVAWPAVEATAISRRKACRLSCGTAIGACIAEGGRRRRCKRQTLQRCRREGLPVCVEPTTTSTSTTSPGATTSVPGASTTTVIGASTTTVLAVSTTSTADGATTTTGGSTSSTAVASTTSMPIASTTSTTFPEVHGCTTANAVDRSGPSDDRTITFGPATVYTPKCMRIAAGQTVTFSGAFEEHPLVGGEVVGFDAIPDPSSPITPTSTGTMQAVLFESGGVFPFYCDFHGVTQSMFGAVQVIP